MALVSRLLSNVSGLALSLACVVHCVMTPICISSLPGWGLTWLSSPYVHQIAAVLGVVIGLWTLIPGWRRHGRHSVLALAGCGLLVMNVSAFAGGDCCQTPAAAGSSESVASCCSEKCCKSASAQSSQVASAGLPAIPFWNWLWQHPTVLGATCLAWAHCLNGGCKKRCCKVVTPIDLGEGGY